MDLRCSGRFRGKPCNKKLGKAEKGQGTVEIQCPKCTKKNKFDFNI